MKFVAWCACWPLLGVFGVAAVVTDAMVDVCDGLEFCLEWLEEYADG
jgi:hypothetical protein